MRGKGRRHLGPQLLHGITPAYAGKSRLCYVLGCFCKDHPRVCGEKKVMRGAKDKRMGSPPHVRGKAQDLTDRQPVCWITPACAGKRRCKAAFCAWFWDHPRMCGEKASHSATLFGVGGSPPHVRGKVGRTLYLVAGERITPAYAGKRLKRSRSTVPHVAIVPLFPSVCNKPVVSDGSPAGRDAPLFLPAENAVPASPAYNLRSL